MACPHAADPEEWDGKLASRMRSVPRHLFHSAKHIVEIIGDIVGQVMTAQCW